MRQRGAEDTYITACMSNTKYHNSTSVHMLFQLVPMYMVAGDSGAEVGEEGEKLELCGNEETML